MFQIVRYGIECFLIYYSLTKDGEISDDASRLRGDISPLTPVALDKSSSSLSDDSDDDADSSPPRTPPLPPPPKFELEEVNIGAQLSDEPENVRF
jgi:hypothetical protein